MSSQNRGSQSSREELLAAVAQAVYENSTTAVFFHTAIAERVGLGATEEKTLLILSDGPLTAGEIARSTGLTTSSVTSLIDRLESKGFVQRVHDVRDRRRIIVEPVAEKLAALNAQFASLGETFAGLLDVYSDEQLATILDFVTRATQYSKKAIAAMNQKREDETSSTS